MITFKNEPLKDFIESTGWNNTGKAKSKKHPEKAEPYIFMLVIAMFFIGSMFSGFNYLGRVVEGKNTEILGINLVYNETANLTLGLKGNVTSLRITGEFIGEGTGKISLGNKLVIDSDKPVSSGNIITGLAIEEISATGIVGPENVSPED